MEKLKQAYKITQDSVVWAGGAGALPFAGVDWAAVTLVQVNLIRRLCKLYDVPFSEELSRAIVSAIVGSSLARGGASLLKTLPGIGSVAGAVGMVTLSAASTYALGTLLSLHFENGGTLANLDVQSAKKVYTRLVQKKQASPSDAQGSSDAVFEKLEKLYELKQKGIITQEEFEQQKKNLLEKM
ncbi:MAG: DUF697 domain-containing protein [Bacteroidia bacterium]